MAAFILFGVVLSVFFAVLAALAVEGIEVYPASYTHLTLPTTLRVYSSLATGGSKKHKEIC